MTDQSEETAFESLSIGERLKRAREEKKLSLDDIAARTRIPIRHLQLIDNDEWDGLPAITYAVGFARNYADAVGLNGQEIGRELRGQLGGRPSRAPAPVYYEPADPARAPPTRAIVIALAAALLVAAYLVWRSTLDDGAPDRPTTAEMPVAPAEAEAPAQRPPPASGQVTLTATGEVWVRVTDGAATLYSGTMAPGATFQVPMTAQAPQLDTGRPQNLRVTVGTTDLGPLEPEERTVRDVSLLPRNLGQRPRGGPAPSTNPDAPLSAPIAD